MSDYLSPAIVGNGLYFVPEQNEPTSSSIQFLNFEAGQIKPVANFEKPFNRGAGSGGLAVSPDGRWILYTQVDQAGAVRLGSKVELIARAFPIRRLVLSR